jgi:hypothetical protein
MWNDAVNDWALSHWEWADIMVEAKCKNLASRATISTVILLTLAGLQKWQHKYIMSYLNKMYGGASTPQVSN